MKNKIIALILVCVTIISATACAKDKDEKATDTVGETEKVAEAQAEEPEAYEYVSGKTYIFRVHNSLTICNEERLKDYSTDIEHSEPYLYYEIKSEDATLYSATSRYALIRDDGKYILIDTEAHTEAELNFNGDDITFAINCDKESGVITGINVYCEDGNKYVPMGKTYEEIKDTYYDILCASSGGIVTAYLYSDNDIFSAHTYFISAETGERLNEREGYYTVISANGKLYYVKSEPMSNNYSEIFTSDMKQIVNAEGIYTLTDNGELVVSEEPYTKYKKYNSEGELISESSEYKNVLFIWKDYALVVTSSDMLTLLDKDGNTAAEFCEWTDNLTFHYMLSGYYQKEGYPTGIYFVVENNDIPYGNEGSGIEYYYVIETGEKGSILTDGVGGYAKPVLYLYPENECEISVEFEHPEYLTVSYPEYKDGWNVKGNTDGTLIYENGRSYYALYWEESGYIPADFKTGFCVSADDAADFLEEKLDEIGLTEREADEFIMYWLPIFKQNKYSLVYFELTDSRESYNGLNISPAPTSLLRLAIHIKKTEVPVNVAPQALPHFERNGFVAVEWGGIVEG